MDDTMEISSEHGHDVGDEDIDIDIDLTTGQVDEDYILEDANSHTSLGDDFQPHFSVSTNNDDLMVDEDGESSRMEDADLIPDDGFQDIEEEEETTMQPFAAVDAPPATSGEHEAPEEGITPRESETTPENTHTPNDIAIKLAVSKELAKHQDQDRSSEKKTKEAEARAEAITIQDPRPPTPSSRNPGRLETNQPKGSSPAISKTSSASENNKGKLPSETEETLVGQSGDLLSTDESSTAPTIPDVLVTYQDTDYALFSSSELDDPDSFFLSDLSIAEKSIADFLKAIRDVIHEDLTNEDELCLSMVDLGIDIEETSTLIHDTTLRQILTLHESLCRNDGIDSPLPPLCIQFGLRPNFSMRLANLAVGAADGKGLSELIVWDEKSDDNDHHGEATDQEALDEQPQEVHEGSHSPQELPVGGDIEPSHELAENALDQGDSSPRYVAQQNIGSATHISPKPEVSTYGEGTGDYDEDGDLIDYSEEETESPRKPQANAASQAEKFGTDSRRAHDGTFGDSIPPCLKPNTCFCSKCNDVLLAEYEAKNEELRRRSVSRIAEANLSEQPTEQTVTVKDEDYGQELGVEIEHGLDHDHNADGELEVNGGVQHHDEQQQHDEQDEYQGQYEYDEQAEHLEQNEYDEQGEHHEQDEPPEQNEYQEQGEHQEHDYYGEHGEHEEALNGDGNAHYVHGAEDEPREHEAEPDNDAGNNGKAEDSSQPLPEPQNGVKNQAQTQEIETGFGNLEHEIDYQDDAVAQDQEPLKLSDEDLGLDIPVQTNLDNEHTTGMASPSTNRGLESNNAVESRIEADGNSHVAPAVVDETVVDEIDYDDDDYEHAPLETQESVLDTEKPLVSLDGTSKRLWEDANLDEEMGLTSKDAKRRRS